MPYTCAGYSITRMTLRMPLTGAWVADLHLDAPESIAGRVSLVLGDATLSGTVLRSGDEYGGLVSARVVAGAGALSRALRARQYSSSPKISAIVADIATESGESISTATSARVDTWHRAAGQTSQAIADVALGLGANWRAGDYGTIVIAADTWPTVEPDDHIIVDRNDATGVITVACETPELRPGTVYDGRRLRSVVHTLDSQHLRSECRYSPGAAESLERFAETIRRRIIYSSRWPARVVSQSGDGTLELVPDDASIAGAGLKRVPIRLGVPGSVTVPKGARVGLQFDGGDPSRPVAVAWDDATLTELSLGAGTDYVALSGIVDSLFSGLQTWLDTHTHPTGVGPSGPPASPSPTPSSTAASKVKAE